MMYLGCLALAAGIVSWVPGVIRLLLFLALWFVFFRYAMTVLVQSARGEFDPDKPAMNIDRDDYRPLKQAGYLVIVIALGMYIGINLSPLLALMFVLGASLALPAAIIVIAIEDSLAEALNPMRLISVMTGIGWPYLLLSLFLLLLQGGDAAIFNLIGARLPLLVKAPLVTFVTMYFLLVMYNMMGYVVYQYHEALGYAVYKSFDEQNADPAMSPVDREIAQKVADGDIQGAVAGQLRDIGYDTNNLVKNQKLHKLYLMLGDAGKTLPHAQQLIGLQASTGKVDAAYETLTKMREISADFAVAEPSAMLPLAEVAKRRRNAALALELLGVLIKKHPRHGDLPGAYLLSAKVLAEDRRDDVEAMRVLTELISYFPNAPQAAEAKTYLSVLERMRPPA